MQRWYLWSQTLTETKESNEEFCSHLKGNSTGYIFKKAKSCFFFFFKSLLTFGFKANFFIFTGRIDGPAISSILFLLKSRLSLCSYMRHVPLIKLLCVCVRAQLCLTLCNLVDYSPLGSSDHGISQVRMLEWIAISCSKGSFQPRDQTQVSCASCIGRQIVYHCPTREDPITPLSLLSCIIICQMRPIVSEMLQAILSHFWMKIELKDSHFAEKKTNLHGDRAIEQFLFTMSFCLVFYILFRVIPEMVALVLLIITLFAYSNRLKVLLNSTISSDTGELRPESNV